MKNYKNKNGSGNNIESSVVGYRDHQDLDGWNKDYLVKI